MIPLLLLPTLVALTAIAGCNSQSSSDNTAKNAEPAQQVTSTPRDATPKANALVIDPATPFPALTTLVLLELSVHVQELAKARDAILAAERDAIRIAMEKFRSSIKVAARAGDPFASALAAVAVPVGNPLQLPADFNWPGNNFAWLWLSRITPDAVAAEPALDGSVLDRVAAMSPEAAAAIDGLNMLVAGVMAYYTAGLSGETSQTSKSDSPSVPISGQQGTATSNVGLKNGDGATTFEIASEANVLLYGLRAKSKVSLTTAFCPDADGHLSFSIRYSGDGTAGKDGTVSYDHNVEAKITATVDDNANLSEADIHLTQATRSAAEGKAVYVETSQNARATGTDYSQWQWGDAQLVRESSQVTTADRNRLAGKGLRQAAQLAAGALVGAEHQWKSGRCIKITATSPGSVKPKATSKIPVSVTHRQEGKTVPAKVTVELSGGESVSPLVIPKAPDDITHIAVDKDGAAMTIKLTATSKRGKAEETLKINTKGMVFKLDGGADEFHGTGIVCDFEKPFVVSGDGLKVKFTPTSKTSGTYNYSGTLKGFGAWGKGTYTVKYDGDNPVHVTAKGPGTVKTPMGDMTAEGTEEYSVSASQDGCPYDKLLLE